MRRKARLLTAVLFGIVIMMSATLAVALPPPPTPTVTTIGSGSLNSTSSFGDTVSFTATVKPTAATGAVTFMDGPTPLGSWTITAGTATLSTSALTKGTHSNITAAYGGNTPYAASTSLAITQTVTIPTDPPLSFAANVDYTTGALPSAITADFDGDGVLDIATANYNDNNVSILLGVGDGTFGPKADFDVGSQPNAVTTGDFNGDGMLDLAVANSFDGAGGNSVSVLIGNGNGTFAASVPYAVGSNPLSVTTGDFNGDGKLDLAVANYFDGAGGNSVSVLIGNGNGTFAASVPYVVGSNPTSVTTGDFNKDGKLDIATANYSGGISVLLGVGDGTFNAKADYTVGFNPYSVTTGDFNKDGNLDIATSNYGSVNCTVAVLIGVGDGTFAASVSYGVGTLPLSVTTGDFNGDGNLDIATANNGDSNVSVLLGAGDGTFATAVGFGVGFGPYSVTAGDFNGDGRVDIAAANDGDPGNTISILLGNIGTATTVSSSPNPSSYGESVTFTATVTPSAANGDVTFMDDVTTLGTGTLSGGTATFSTSALGTGTHSNITAVYVGDSTYGTSTSDAYTHTVNKAATTTAVKSWPNPSMHGDTVTFKATVTPSAAAGTVTFKDGGATLGTGTLSSGKATFSTSALSAGTHSNITAVYGGDANYATSTSTPFFQMVNAPVCEVPASITVPATNATGSYSVSWAASATAGATYLLQETTDSGFTANVRTAYTGTATTASITGRATGTTYYYRVLASKTGYITNAWCIGANGCVVTITVLPACGMPSSITVPTTGFFGSYTVRWGASATPGVTYTLQEATNSTFTVGLRTAYTGTAQTKAITGRPRGKTYYYRVMAAKTGYTASVWKKGSNGCYVR